MQNSNQLIGLRRGIKVLELLAASGNGLSFNQIKDAFNDLPPSTISRLLKVLMDEEMIFCNTESRLYSLAERSGKLANAIKGTLSTAQKLQPVLDRLARATGCSAAFFEHRNNRIELTAKTEMPEAFHYSPVGSYPFSVEHGFRKLYAAYVSADERKRLYGDPFPEGFDFDSLRSLEVLVNLHDDQPNLKRIVAPVFYKNRILAGILGISFYRTYSQAGLDRMTGLVKDEAASTVL